MSYLNATHACASFTVTKSDSGYMFTAERMEPCRFVKAQTQIDLIDYPVTTYHYESLWPNLDIGELFYTYEPLPQWGAL